MTTLRIEETAAGITFDLIVAPRASRNRIGPVVGDRLKVAVTAPPVEGKANAAVASLLAEALGVRRSDVEILSGESGKRKRVRVAGARREQLLALLEEEA